MMNYHGRSATQLFRRQPHHCPVYLRASLLRAGTVHRAAIVAAQPAGPGTSPQLAGRLWLCARAARVGRRVHPDPGAVHGDAFRRASVHSAIHLVGRVLRLPVSVWRGDLASPAGPLAMAALPAGDGPGALDGMELWAGVN